MVNLGGGPHIGESAKMEDKIVLGIDIGGTKLAAGVVDLSGQVYSYLRQPTPSDTDGEGLLAAIIAQAEQAVRASGLTPVVVGVGCGGPMQYPVGLVSPLHIAVWRDFPLKARLETAFGLPVVVDNDAKALALGEWRFGAGHGAHSLMGMVVSTGVGSGVVLEGRLLHGVSGNAGHIGHVIVMPEGAQCECGARGCLTAYASGTGMAHRAHLALQEGVASQLARLPLAEITALAIAEAARNGDKLSQQLWDEAGTGLARAIAAAASLFDLDRVVIGGGMTLGDDLLFGPLRREWQRCARLPFTRDLDIRPAGLGHETGVIGAASLVLE